MPSAHTSLAARCSFEPSERKTYRQAHGAVRILEVSCPRIPCTTFQGWMAQAGWIKRFTQAGRSGTYLRVIKPGEIRAGDEVEVVHRPEYEVSVSVCFRALTLEPELLPRLLGAKALPAELKERALRRAG